MKQKDKKMQISLTEVKILESTFRSVVLEEKWCGLLLEGKLYEFEAELHICMLRLYEQVSEQLILQVSRSVEFKAKQRAVAEEAGLKKLSIRCASVQLRTGAKIKYDSLYSKIVPVGYTGSRHVSEIIWGCGASSGWMYKSLSCLYSVLCPSFEVSKALLEYQGIKANFERIRQLSLSLATEAMEARGSVQLLPGETLSTKRVIIGIDGGRSRTRVYESGKVGRSEKFAAVWREPKMFVITSIDEHGKVTKGSKPLYDSTFGDDELFVLLGKYLKELEIAKAESVQILADGTAWVWNRVKAMLMGLGVKEDKIIETLDYYHASEHLSEMKVYFAADKKGLFEQLKDALWQGDLQEMGNILKEGISGVDLENFNPYKYFEKQRNRIDYESLKAQNRPRGSGIIESGIRRIINLRFKSPSTFWYPENVEKLIFMRSVALAGRWQAMMKNLSG